MALALFVSGVWWRMRVDARRGAIVPQGGAQPFLLLYLFPSHASNPMVFGPTLLARPASIDVRGLATLGFWFVVKVAALLALRQLGPGAFLRGLTAADAANLPAATLWGVVTASYVETYLVLAASADIPVMIGRLFGFPLHAAFRAPLLAWNPVELWRRWGMYNRRLLIDLVYRPLGGVIATCTATSCSRSWPARCCSTAAGSDRNTGRSGAAGWLDQSLYFSLQGVAVCACLAAGAGRASDQVATTGGAGRRRAWPAWSRPKPGARWRTSWCWLLN